MRSGLKTSGKLTCFHPTPQKNPQKTNHYQTCSLQTRPDFYDAISPGRLSGNRVISRLTDLRHEWEWRTIRSKDLRAKQKGAEESSERKEAERRRSLIKKFERQQINIASGSSKNPPGGAGRLSQPPHAVAERDPPLEQMPERLKKAR